MKIGLIVNPMAGIGGSAALKGSDGKEIQKLAIERGAKPKANERAKEVFEILKSENSIPEIVAAPGVMDPTCSIVWGLSIKLWAI